MTKLPRMKRSVVTVRPGDTVILQSPQPLPQAARENITKTMNRLFPNNTVLVLESGLEFRVARKQPARSTRP